MKLLKLTLAFFFFAATAKSQYVHANLPASIIEGITETTAFFVQDSAANRLILHVYNPKQNKLRIILYKDGMRYCYRTSDIKFRKSFNFANADEGNYSLYVFDGKRSVEKKITVIPSSE